MTLGKDVWSFVLLAWKVLLEAVRKPVRRVRAKIEDGPLSPTSAPEIQQELYDVLSGLPSGILSHDQVDVCIITTCHFPGGNASSTIDEVRAFEALGRSVRIIHLPIGEKRKPLSQRFADIKENIVHVDDVKSMQADIVIVRAPRVIMESKFAELSNRIRCIARSVFVINNSAFRPNGDKVFEWDDLLSRVEGVEWPARMVCPLGPAIRKEADMLGFGCRISSQDWPPLFNGSVLQFQPKAAVTSPIIVGRHGRDGPEKWLKDPEQIRLAYPTEGDVEVRFLGGADRPIQLLGHSPTNWHVYPFGSKDVAEFLEELDVFVNYPDENLNEAFGRTIAEAMFVGVPCIVPIRFADTFGDLAIYSEPRSVRSVLGRLQQRDDCRQKFLSEVREIAFSQYDVSNLFKRLEHNTGNQEMIGLSEGSLRYKTWLQNGVAAVADLGNSSPVALLELEDRGPDMPPHLADATAAIVLGRAFDPDDATPIGERTAR